MEESLFIVQALDESVRHAEEKLLKQVQWMSAQGEEVAVKVKYLREAANVSEIKALEALSLVDWNVEDALDNLVQ